MPKPINFKALNSQLLVNSCTLVPSWLPNGRLERQEWVALNPTRGDKNLGSFRVNLKTGRWGDFATGDKGGDLVSLYAYVKGISQGSSAKELIRIIGERHDR